MSRVQVLISTYNGEKYIADQIDSILGQTYSNISILVRDDASKDGTVDILKSYQDKGLIKYYSAEVNTGFRHSFFDLIQNADKGCQYFIFADQDDFWMSARVENAIRDILEEEEEESTPILHSCRFINADEKLNKINRKIKISKPAGLGNSLIECPFLGFTMLFNKKMLDCLSMITDATDIRGHDMAAVIIACMFGKIITGNSVDVLYRQHSRNVSGGLGKTWFQEIKIKAKMALSFLSDDTLTKNAYAMYNVFESIIDDTNRKIFLEFINRNKSLSNRMRIFRNKEFKRQTFVDNIIVKTVFLLGLKY